jgi:hypothetical protein
MDLQEVDHQETPGAPGWYPGGSDYVLPRRSQKGVPENAIWAWRTCNMCIYVCRKEWKMSLRFQSSNTKQQK